MLGESRSHWLFLTEFYTPWKHKKKQRFLQGIEIEYWRETG